MVFKKSFLILILFLLAIVSACSGASTSEKIYDHLEKAVELEDTFVKQQDPIVELEKKEQKIYSQIIDLGMDEFEKIKELSKQAIENIEKRKEKIELEKESINASKDEFTKIDGMIEDLEEDKAKESAQEMYEVMTNRYDAYDQLYEAYSKTLKLEKDLYTMLQKKDLEQETLTKHIEKVNKSYQQVIKVNKKFNELTTEYNALKEEFYTAAGIDAEYDNDAPTGDKKSEE